MCVVLLAGGYMYCILVVIVDGWNDIGDGLMVCARRLIAPYQVQLLVRLHEPGTLAFVRSPRKCFVLAPFEIR